MSRARDPSAPAVYADGGQRSPLSLADINDPDFARRLDLWGAYHRLGVAAATMALTFVIVPQPDWLLWPAVLYLGLAVLVPGALEHAGSAPRKAYVRSLVLLIDVGLVSLFVYRWGAR
ncbi:MAG TPA: hypothetical protein VG963_16295, partial [Polyangiaceae bacterium]|nr:hypothetical protein [Polyangiaceae bacterium]